MGFEGEATTVAGHLTLVFVLTTIAVRVMMGAMDGHFARAAAFYGLTTAVALAATMLVIERLYYVIARVTRSASFDLYMAHPAPELLSLALCFGFWGLSVPIIKSRAASKLAAARRIGLEALSVAAIWVGLVVVLH